MLEQWIVVHNFFVLGGKLSTRVQGQRATILPHAWPPTTPSTDLVRQASQEKHHAMAAKDHMYAACAVQRRYHVIQVTRSDRLQYSLRGSSPRPMAHKTIALTTELREPWELCWSSGS